MKGELEVESRDNFFKDLAAKGRGKSRLVVGREVRIIRIFFFL